MLRFILVLLVLGFYALHQDIWFWRTAQPVVFGVLPIGLFYHAAYTAAISLLMWGLVRLAWPGHLDDDTDAVGVPVGPHGRSGTDASGRNAASAVSPASSSTASSAASPGRGGAKGASR
jgi:hypothetical protein